MSFCLFITITAVRAGLCRRLESTASRYTCLDAQGFTEFHLNCLMHPSGATCVT